MSERAKARIAEVFVFRMALESAAKGDPSHLETLIRSDLRFGLFSSHEREAMADLLEGLRKRGRGRPSLHPGKPQTRADREKRALDDCVADVRWAKARLKDIGSTYHGRAGDIPGIVLEIRAAQGK